MTIIAAYTSLAAFVTLTVLLRYARVIAGALALTSGVIILSASLGRPKPMWLELECPSLTKREATVIAAIPDETRERILLWLDSAECEPTVYTMPWDKRLAQQLQEAIEGAERNGTEARMSWPTEPTLDNREPKFYALPQPAMPLKPQPHAPLEVPEEDA